MDLNIFGAFKGMINGASRIIDKVVTNKEEAINAKTALAKVLTQHAETIAQTQSEIIKSESSGNWLQRSWRPIIMLSFGFIVVYAYFLDPVFGSGTASEKIPKEFFTLLELGIGGYVIGRSAEKISATISDKMLFKKK